MGLGTIYAVPGDSWADPKPITNGAQLSSLQANLYYKVMNDITVSGTPATGILVPNGVKIDGDDYLITISAPIPTGAVLFYSLTGGILKNIRITYDAAHTNIGQGTLIAEAHNCEIRNCRLDPNSLTPTVTGGDAGGLIGWADGCAVINCRTKANVNGSRNLGGLIGVAENTTVDQCFATGNVYATENNIGGLIGNTDANVIVTNSYALGDVTTSYGLVTANRGSVANQTGTTCTAYVNSNTCGATDQTSPRGGDATYYPSPNIRQANIGGLIGYNEGSINNCYAIGDVSITGSSITFFHWYTHTTPSFAPSGGSCDPCNPGCPDTYSYTPCSYNSYANAKNYTRKPSHAGKLIGNNLNTNVTNSRASGTVTGYDDLSGQGETDGAYNWVQHKGIYGGGTPVHSSTTAATAASMVNAGTYPSSWSITTTNNCMWTIIEGQTYPLLQVNVVDSCLKNDIKKYHENFNTGNNCSRYQYTVNASDFTIKGSLDYYPGNIPTNLNYYFTIDQIHNSTFFNLSPGKGTGAYTPPAQHTDQFPYTPALRSSGSITYVPSTPKAQRSFVRMWAFAGISSTPLTATDVNTPSQATSTFSKNCSYGYKDHTGGNETFMLTTIQPLPTAKWNQYVDPYFNDAYTWLKHNTICYDYRDLGSGTDNVAAKYDTAYIRLEMTGTAPFTFMYDKKNIANGTHADHLGDDVVTEQILLTTGTEFLKQDFDSVWRRPSGDPNTYYSRYGLGDTDPGTGYHRLDWLFNDVVYNVLPNHVDTTAYPRPLGGMQPNYTGYNLTFNDTAGLYIQDKYCYSDYTYAYYNEMYTPYGFDDGTDTYGGSYDPATAPYDTVVVNPLPTMNYPYEEWHHPWAIAADPALRFSHNDTVVCEGDTIFTVVFDSPIIHDEFRDSMHYGWEAASSQALNLTNFGWGTDVVPNGVFGPSSQHLMDLHYVFSDYTQSVAPFNPLYYLIPPDRDTIPGVQNDLLNRISVGYSAITNSGLDSVPEFATNDDHYAWLRNNTNDGWDYGPGVLRDTVSRAFVRVYPYFVNYKGGICFAKDKNYGYRDYHDIEYRGVTDYAITVNPRPHPTVDTAYQAVCNLAYTEPVFLGTQIRQGSDTIWYALRDYYPHYGSYLSYDSISPVAVPQVNDGTGAGAMFDPSLPIGRGAYPFTSDSIKSFRAENPNRVAIFDTINVIPYFINRKTCIGIDTLIRYRINPTTTIVTDLAGDTICDESITTKRIDVGAYGTDLNYNWYYRPEIGSPQEEVVHKHYEHWFDVDKSGSYQVHVVGVCGDRWSREVDVLFDKTPQWIVDLDHKEQLCEGENSVISVAAAGAKRYVWYLDNDSIGETNSYAIADPKQDVDYGIYSVKAISTCGKELLSTPARIWVVKPLTTLDLDLKDTPSTFIAGVPTQVSVGYDYGHMDVTNYEWKYISSGGIEDNAHFSHFGDGSAQHSPYVTFDQADNGFIYVDLYHACGTNGVYTSQFKSITVTPGTGIDGTTTEAVIVFPNPVNTELNVMSESAIESIVITDIKGRVIYKEHDVKSNTSSIFAGGWPTGSYIVTVKNATETVTHKIIKE